MEKEIYADDIKQILTTESCTKMVLFDNETSTIFSNLIPHSKFLENDFFHFDLITNKRQKVAKVLCYVIIRAKNYKCLIDELRNPSFNDYVVYFTNSISDNILSEIASKDINSAIRKVYEIYADVCRQDNNLFTIFPKKYLFPDMENTNNFERVCDGIYSFLRTLNISPNIYTFKKQEITHKMGEEINKKISRADVPAGGNLLILDRSFDLFTPLVHEWTYQSMIYEYCDFENGLVNLNNKTYNIVENVLYKELKFKDFNTASSRTKSFINNIEASKRISKSVIENIEIHNQQSEAAEVALEIQKKIFTECKNNIELSEMEFQILKENKIKISDVSNMLKNKSFSHEKRLKLFLIYLLKNNYNFDNANDLSKLRISFVNFFPEFQKAMNKFSVLFDTKNNNIDCVFNEQTDIKLGYIPRLRNIVENAIKGKFDRKKFVPVKNIAHADNTLIIYIKGGVTYLEYKNIMEVIENRRMLDKKGTNIYLLSDCIIGYKDIIEHICDK